MIILLNGPPRSGKDTAAGFVVKYLSHTTHYKLSRPLKGAVHKIFDISGEVTGHFEANKESPSPHLLGRSYRQTQIDLYLMLESHYGPDVLARLLIRYLKKNDASKHIVLSDCGRTAEGQALVSHFGGDKVARIKLFRPGCDFSQDIREYVKINCERDTSIDNEYDLDVFEAQVKRVLKRWRLIDEE